MYVKLGQLDFAAELAQLRAAKPEALYVFFPGGMGINFVKQFVASGLSKDITLLLPGFSADQDTIPAVGDAMLGIFNTSQWSRSDAGAAEPPTADNSASVVTGAPLVPRNCAWVTALDNSA